jgi:hypothetical protein
VREFFGAELTQDAFIHLPDLRMGVVQSRLVTLDLLVGLGDGNPGEHLVRHDVVADVHSPLYEKPGCLRVQIGRFERFDRAGLSADPIDPARLRLGGVRSPSGCDFRFGSIPAANFRDRHGRTCFNTGRQGTQPPCRFMRPDRAPRRDSSPFLNFAVN